MKIVANKDTGVTRRVDISTYFTELTIVSFRSVQCHYNAVPFRQAVLHFVLFFRSLNQKHNNWRFNDARNSWHSQLSIKLSCAIRDVGRDICHLFVFLRLCRCLRAAESTGNLVGYVLCGFRTASLCSQYFPALINDEHSTAGLLGGFSLEAYRANEAI